MLLTTIKIEKAKPKDKPYKLRDGDGLFVLIHPNGGKYWRLRYSFARKEKEVALGTYPEVSLSDARDKRLAARKLVAGGLDPGAKKKEEKRLEVFNADNTFKAVAEDWHGRNKSKWTPDHAERLWRRLELYAFADLDSQPIASIKTPNLIALLRKVEKRGTLETAHRLAQTLNVVFRYAVHCGLIDQNPASDLRGVVAPHKATNFPTINAKELPEFFEKLDAVGTNPQNKIATRLLMLTFLRPGELQKSLWTDIDFESKQWRIPAERMKMRKPHMVPLARQAITLLQQLKEITGHSVYVFPSQQRQKNPYMSENTINQMLKRMGYKDKLVAHGFRALASTTLNEMSHFGKDIIEAQLSHMDEDKIRGTYNRAEYAEQRIKMMQWWADYIDAAASGNDKVVIGQFGKKL